MNVFGYVKNFRTIHPNEGIHSYNSSDPIRLISRIGP